MWSGAGVAAIVLAGLAGLFFAGVTLLIDSNKGQLVIDSEVDVQVKLVQVDDSGAKREVSELKIMPGTKATRLTNGRYEIVLDGASDSFSVNNDTFTIRNGETIIATITPKLAASEVINPNQAFNPLASSSGMPSSLASDAKQETQPSQSAVYDGRTLEQWVYDLKFERNNEQIGRALNALEAMAEPSHRQLLEQPLHELILRDNPVFRPVAMRVLDKCTGKDFLASVNELLAKTKNQDDITKVVTLTLNLLGQTVRQEGEPYGILFPHIEKCLNQDNTNSVYEVFRAVRDLMVRSSKVRFTQQHYSDAIAMLSRTAQLNDKGYWWFQLTDTAMMKDNRTTTNPARAIFVPQFNREVIRRALAVLASTDESSSISETSSQQPDEALRGRAWLVLRVLLEDGYQLSDDESIQLQRAIEGVLTQAIGPPIDVSISQLSPIYVAPKWLNPQDVSFPASTAFPGRATCLTSSHMLALNVLATAQLQTVMKDELQRFRENLDQTALYNILLKQKLETESPIIWLDYVQHPTLSSKFLRQMVYGQVASLLGSTRQDILNRFAEKREIDIQEDINDRLRQLENGELQILGELAQLLPKTSNPIAASVLERTFLKLPLGNYKNKDGERLHLSLWMQTAGESFLPRYTEALAKADPQTRRSLLGINLTKDVNFSCKQPEALKPLLAWAAQELGNLADIDSNNDSKLIISFLTRLLENTDSVSAECQSAIIARLAKYPALNNSNYWLIDINQTVTTEKILSTDFGANMRLEKLRRAIDAVSSEPTASPEVRCLAWIVCRQFHADLDKLPDEKKADLAKAIQRTFTRVNNTANFEQLGTLVTLPHFYYAEVYPAFESRAIDRFNESDAAWNVLEVLQDRAINKSSSPANELVLLLNLLFDLQDELKQQALTPQQDQLKAFHQWLEEQNIEEEYSNSGPTTEIMRELARKLTERRNGTEGWHHVIHSLSESSPVGAQNISALTNNILPHTWYVQSGVLLGKDYSTLLGRPAKLRTESLARQARLIQPGDTLAVYIPMVLPQSGDPPIIQAGTRTPAIGYPVIVSNAGNIDLPLLGTIETKEIDLDELKKRIVERIAQSQYFKNVPSGITVQFLLRRGEQLELRNVTNPSPPPQNNQK